MSWPNFQRTRDPGQVPTRDLDPRLTAMPGPVDRGAARLSYRRDIVNRPIDVVRNLGLTKAQEAEVVRLVSAGLTNPELTFMTTLYQHLRMRGDYDEGQRQAIVQRARTLYAAQGVDQNRAELLRRRLEGLRMQKAEETEVRLVVPSDFLKAQPRGGNYHARVTHPETGKHRYFYDPEKYEARPDAHLSGRSVLKKKCVAELVKRVTAQGECTMDDLKLEGYDDDLVKDAIRAAVKAGTLQHTAGKLTPKLAKSVRYVIRQG